MSDTLIDAVKQLAEREKMNRPVLPLELRDDWYLYDDQLAILDTMTPCESNKLMVDLRNAAPKLLDVLSHWQAGDATRIELLQRIVPGVLTKAEEDLLARMQNMAFLMEAIE